jgi:RNA recognition motif-containing protein
MPKKLYVGNLPFSATEESVRAFFGAIGEVTSVNIISDTYTGRPRGFAFIEMENADAAIAELNGKELEGRPLKVSIAVERERGGRGGFGGGGRGGDFHRGGGGGGHSGGRGGYGNDRRGGGGGGGRDRW